jgi:GT2 family glycosyltransferase
LNYNGIKWLKKFIPFFIKFSEKEADIFVIDNGSTDQSIEFLKKNHSEVCIVPLLKNLGFAGGYNEGLKKINSKYFILVNSDIEVTNSWIPPMIKILRNNTNIVAVQPKILSFNNKNKFEHAGAAGGFIDAFGFTFCKGRIFDNTEIDEGQYNQDKEIFWASGACIAVKAEEFKKIGGFDEDFFAHMEEVDLC